MTTRIEIAGNLTRSPEVRVTPSGTNILHLAIACCEAPERLVLEVLMVGGEIPESARDLRAGDAVRAIGSLRAVPIALRKSSRLGIEVVATHLERAIDRNSSVPARSSSNVGRA